MIVLYVVFAILAIILAAVAFLLTQRIRLCITYGDDMHIAAKLLFIKYTVYPQKDKKEKKKKKTKPKSKPKSKSKSEPSDQSVGDSHAKKKKKSPLETLGFITSLVSELLSRLGKALSVDINTVAVTVPGADDAAKAAVEYGTVCAAVQSLLAFTDNYPDKVKLKGTPAVDINYLASKHNFRLDIVINIGIYKTISALIHTAIRYITSK